MRINDPPFANFPTVTSMKKNPAFAMRPLSLCLSALLAGAAGAVGAAAPMNENNSEASDADVTLLSTDAKTPALISFEAGSKTIRWDTDHGESGKQVARPLALAYETAKYSLGIRGLYLGTDRHYDVDNAVWGGSNSGWTDTSVSAAYRGAFNDSQRWQLRVEANLPTGDAALKGREKNVIANHLFLERVYWGEGRNIQIDGTFTQALSDQLALSATAAYVHRDAYHHDGDRPDSELDPGEQSALSANLTWKASRSLVSVSGRYVHESTSELDGRDFHDRGDAFEIAAFGSHQLAAWTLTAAAFHSSRDNDRVRDPITGRLVTEHDRAASPVTSIFAGVDYKFNDAWSVGATGRRVWAGENEYDVASARFLPERNLKALELYATWSPTRASSFRLAATAFRQTDEDPAGIEDAKYRGHSVGLTYRMLFDR